MVIYISNRQIIQTVKQSKTPFHPIAKGCKSRPLDLRRLGFKIAEFERVQNSVTSRFCPFPLAKFNNSINPKKAAERANNNNNNQFEGYPAL